MRNLKSLIFGLAALCLAFGLVFTVSAFKSKGTAQRAPIYFLYDGDDYTPTDFRDVDNWTHESSPTSCGGSTNLCVLKVDDANLSGDGTLEEQLIEYFNSMNDPALESYVSTPANIQSKRD